MKYASKIFVFSLAVFVFFISHFTHFPVLKICKQSLNMPRKKGKFMKASELKRRESCSRHMHELNKLRSQPNEPTVEKPLEKQPENDKFVQPTITPPWRTGRRIVELGSLADQLRSCVDCGQPLQLHHIQSETRYGLGSILYIQCICGVTNAVSTNKTHRTPSSTRGRPTFDINTKSALGMYHAGMGQRNVTHFLSAIEVPGLHHKSLKAREQEIQEHVKRVARESCDEALRTEASTSTKNDRNTDTCAPISEATFKYDMGWQKRGSGRSYSSKSGVGTMIGNESGKICAYEVRQSDCRTCQVAARKGTAPSAHACHKNWSGSAKAMEPDVGSSLVKEVEGKGVNVSTIIMDDDTTTMARLRQTVSHDIVKWSDTNHTAKHLTNSLYALQKKHKVLTTPVINFLKKCFNYALVQNKGNVDGCRSAILQIVPHSFGAHENCDKSWCGYHKNPDTYQHGTLAKDLSGEELRLDLESVFLVFANNAEKIAPGGSTKDVESFNNMVASKAPKRCHFSGSGSLYGRVDCAVAQKNLGHSYVNKVNIEAGLSPGKVYESYAIKKDTERKRQLEYYNRRDVKKRRLVYKLDQKKKQSSSEVREGITYKSAVAISHHSDITEIPASVPVPVQEKFVINGQYQQVFCDIETTSLQKNCDIVQISAICGKESFDQYITPTKSMAPRAAEVTGLTSQGGVLFYNGTPVTTLPLKCALQRFIGWLDNRAPVVLIGHKFQVFDFPRIIRVCHEENLQAAFAAVVTGAVDTHPLFKELYPDRGCYTQEQLVADILQEPYAAHNALEDVTSLQKLVQKCEVSNSILSKHSFTTESSYALFAHQQMTDKNMNTMTELVEKKFVTKGMAEKIGKSGLQLAHLQIAFTRGGVEGLTNLLSEKVNGKPRVTSSKRVIEQLAEAF